MREADHVRLGEKRKLENTENLARIEAARDVKKSRLEYKHEKLQAKENEKKRKFELEMRRLELEAAARNFVAPTAGRGYAPLGEMNFDPMQDVFGGMPPQ